jgi:hypothetical protein
MSTAPTLGATAKLSQAVTPSRSLLFYTLTAALPVVIIVACLLFLSLPRPVLGFMSAVGAIVSAGACGKLLYDLTLDVAGFPDYKLPVWAVFYLIVYIVMFFTFVFFTLHLTMPDVYLGGIGGNQQAAFLDTLYLSLSNYLNAVPDPSVIVKGRTARFFAISQALLSMFINIVIITKFVNTF